MFSFPLTTSIISYKMNRFHFFVYDAHISHWYDSTVGVPQRSNLRPLFLLNFIDDLSLNFDCQYLLLADPRLVKATENCIYLQDRLSTIVSKGYKNSLLLNIFKYEFVPYIKETNLLVFIYKIRQTSPHFLISNSWRICIIFSFETSKSMPLWIVFCHIRLL